MSKNLKREIFRRATRMVHRFGDDLSPSDPVGGRSFDPGFPVSPSQRSSRALEVQRDGEYRYCDPQSPVVSTKTGRTASLNGPAPDLSDAIAQTIPPGTVKRKR